MLITRLGPEYLLVLTVRRGHSEVEVPVIGDHPASTRCSVTTDRPWGLTTTCLEVLVHGAAGVNMELLSTFIQTPIFGVHHHNSSSSSNS